MSSVVIRPDDGQPDSLKAILAGLRAAAGPDARVVVGSGGVVVTAKVARLYLNATLPEVDTSGRTTDNTRTPLITRRRGDTPGTVPADHTSIGGLSPEAAFPGGHPGMPADAQTTAAGQAAAGDSGPEAPNPAPGPERTNRTTPKPAKKTAAAQQRASRTTRSNP